MPHPLGAAAGGLETLGRPIKRRCHAVHERRNAKTAAAMLLPGARREVIQCRDTELFQMWQQAAIECAPITEDDGIQSVRAHELQ